jgi:GTP-binding protein Era
MSQSPRCGFVAVIGAPNVGKSTLVNRAVGAKVTIVSPKAQTTRRRVLGLAMRNGAQIVFIDTPGIFAPKRRLDRAMVAAAWSGASDADIALLLVDAAHAGRQDVEPVLEKLKADGCPVWLVINKIDAVDRQSLLETARVLNALHPFAATFMVSAKNGDGVDDLLNALSAALPEGPHHFPPDQLTDLPMRLLAAEITREHLFRRLHQELPYALTVETEDWEEFKDGSAKVRQVIFVEREGQKAIVVGQAGKQIKAVREAAQRELEQMCGRKIHLFLFVKTREKWQEDRERFREMGLEYDV